MSLVDIDKQKKLSRIRLSDESYGPDYRFELINFEFGLLQYVIFETDCHREKVLENVTIKHISSTHIFVRPVLLS